jgi:hypothetical protein
MSLDVQGTTPVRKCLAFGLVFLAAVVALQWSAGAYRAEQGFYDEALHFMNGLLVRDYLAEGLGQSPIAFAESYYRSYPKIAPGMWPPLFHITLGFVLLPHWPAHAATLLFLAAITAWAAWRLYRIVALFASTTTAVIAALLFLSTPVIMSLTTSVMVDGMVAMLAIEATWWLAVYVKTERLRHAALFGLFTALCCLTKGNGISLVFAPLVIVVLTGRYDLLRRPGFYLAAAIVVLLAAPPLVVTYRLDAAIGDFGPITQQMALSRLALYVSYFWTQLGPTAMVFAAIGLLDTIRRGRRWQEDAPLPVAPALTALLVGSFIFHIFSPHLLAFGRYMALAVPALYGLAALGVYAAARFIAAPTRRHAVQAALLVIFAVTTFFARPPLTVRKPLGYEAAVDHLRARDDLAGKRMLIVSDESGEGTLVTDVARRGLAPRPSIIRGSKLLASDDWNGNFFVMRYTSAESIMQELEDLHISYVIIDSSPESMKLPYWALMKRLVESHEDRLQVEYFNSADPRDGPTRPLAVYKLKYQSPGPPKGVEIDLRHSVKQLLRR